jgi:hypothetical protein
MNVLVLDHVRKTIRAQYVVVTFLRRLLVDFDFHILLHPERPCNIILVGRPLRLLLGVKTPVNQLLQ